MVDYTKLEANHPEPKLLVDSFDFTRDVNIYTGEIKSKFDIAKIGRYGYSEAAIEVKLFPSGRIWLSGSLHKFWHGNNHSNFGYQELKDCIDYLTSLLGIPPDKWKILQMEYGVNIRTSFNPDDYLNRLIAIKYRPFNRMKPTKRASGYDCELSDWSAKFYNKGKQNSLPYHLLRVEKKAATTRYLRALNINTLADLNQDSLDNLANNLLEMLNLVQFNDKSINLNLLTSRQKTALANYRNPIYWKNATRFGAIKARKIFEQLISKYGSENYYGEVVKLTKCKLNQLNSRGNVCRAVKDAKQLVMASSELENNNFYVATFANRF